MSHETALQEDTRKKLTPGQVLTTVVIEDNVDDEEKALAKCRKVTVFIKSDDFDLEVGDTVWIKIADVRPNSALALALAKEE